MRFSQQRRHFSRIVHFREHTPISSSALTIRSEKLVNRGAANAEATNYNFRLPLSHFQINDDNVDIKPSYTSNINSRYHSFKYTPHLKFAPFNKIRNENLFRKIGRTKLFEYSSFSANLPFLIFLSSILFPF